MSIRIEKIILSNFRQYKKFEIDITEKKTKDLHVFIAENGVGKTTLLSAINWCLYADESPADTRNQKKKNDNGNSLQLANDSVLEESAENDTILVYVELVIKDNDKTITFKRVQTNKVIIDAYGMKKVLDDNRGKFIATITYNNEYSNPEIKEDEYADALVNQYFHSSISEYYFFDGEKLSSYFETGKGDKIKESIHSICQLNILSNTIRRLTDLSTSKCREAGRIGNVDIATLREQKEALVNANITLQSQIDKAKDETIPKLNDENRIKKALCLQEEPITKMQAKRERYERIMVENDNALKSINEEKIKFVRKYIVLLNMYSSIKKSYEIIEDKYKKGELPSNIDVEEIMKIINGHVKECPLCQTKITDEIIKRLNESLEKDEKIKISNVSSTQMTKIKNTLFNIIEETKKYEEIKRDIISRQKIIMEKIEIDNFEYKSILDYLSQVPANERIDVAKLNREISQANEQIITLETMINTNTSLINTNLKDIDICDEKIENALNNESAKQKLISEVRLLRNAETHLTNVRDVIMHEMRDKLQQLTWKHFSNMIWKKNTFSKLVISENYELSLFNTNGRPVTLNASSTEKMALAYAFSLAIHEVSGRNCSLVIDSPLGRVSSKNRDNMAKVLLDSSKEKQIIMLLTPDEYSKEVSDIYENVVDIRMLKLTSDEKSIDEGVE